MKKSRDDIGVAAHSTLPSTALPPFRVVMLPHLQAHLLSENSENIIPIFVVIKSNYMIIIRHLCHLRLDLCNATLHDRASITL